MVASSKPSSRLTRGRAKRVFKVGELATSVGSSYIWEALRRPFRSAGSHQQALLDTHIRNAMRKLDADTRTEAVAKALRQSLID